ncbi:hypothetical protein BH10PSE7_BH10PSE7_32630 [soil metagenome]
MALMVAVAADPVCAADYRLLVLDGSLVKWGPAETGTGAVVTWSFVKDAVTLPKARNCSSLMPFDTLEMTSNISMNGLRSEAEGAFAAWEAVADLDFRYTADPATADILIGAQGQPMGRAFTNVALSDKTTERALADAPGGPDAASPHDMREIRQSLICLNPLQRWKTKLDGDLDVYDLKYTLTHEIGHAIGLDHPGSGGALMGFRYQEKVQGLRPGDIQAAQTLYGVRPPRFAQVH